MSAPYVSIIVPVYKVESYLSRCLKSIQAQTFGDFEALLIDDGSPDGSGALCDAFAQADARFVALHQPNGGVGRARNNGLAKASGRFVAFVDSDDFVGPDYLKNMVDAQMRRDADLVIARYRSLSERTMRENWRVPEAPERFIERGDFGGALPELYNQSRIGVLYSKLFRRSVLDGAKVREDLKMRSDVVMVSEVLERVSSIQLINNCDYSYVRYRSGNITRQVDADLFLTHIEINRLIAQSMERCGVLNGAMQDSIDKRIVDAARLCVDSIRMGGWSLEEKGAHVDRILQNPVFKAAFDRRGAKSTGKLYDLMRAGRGVEVVRFLDDAEKRRVPLVRALRPLASVAAKIGKLLRGC